MTNENFNENKNIDLMELLSRIWRYKFFIILVVIAAMSLSYVNVKYFTADTYSLSMNLYLKNKDTTSTQLTGDVKITDISTSRIFSETCIEIMKSDPFIKEIAIDSGTDYSFSQLRSMVSISSVNETELLIIRITSYSPEDTVAIAQSVRKIAPKMIVDITGGGSANFFGDIETPEHPVGKGLAQKMIYTGVVAAVLFVGIIFLIMIFDKKVHKGEDIEKRYGVPVLGEIS